MDGFTLTNSQYAGDNPRADDDLNFDDLVQTSFSLKNTDFNRAPTLDQTINVPEDEEFQDSKFEVVLKLSDLQGDPNSPLYSIKKFEELGLLVNHSSHLLPPLPLLPNCWFQLIPIDLCILAKQDITLDYSASLNHSPIYRFSLQLPRSY